MAAGSDCTIFCNTQALMSAWVWQFLYHIVSMGKNSFHFPVQSFGFHSTKMVFCKKKKCLTPAVYWALNG
jgi:hypothetical protein